MIELVPATIKDVDFVYACITELEQTAFDKDVFENVYRQLLAGSICFPFVITHNQELIGYMSIHIQVLLHHNGNVAEIQELVVLPEFRNGGAGKTAVEFAKTFARQKGCVLIELASSLKRTGAHRFYLHNGFKQSHYKFTFSLD